MTRRALRRYTHNAAPPLQRGSMPARPWGRPWTGARPARRGRTRRAPAPAGAAGARHRGPGRVGAAAPAAPGQRARRGADAAGGALRPALRLGGGRLRHRADGFRGAAARRPRRCCVMPTWPRQPLAADASTAVIMPICNEHVPTVFAGLRATAESLVAAGGARLTEIYVLSDSADPALRAAELAAWQRLRAALRRQRPAGALPLARPPHATARPATWPTSAAAGAGRHRYMVVLDADSVMSGDADPRPGAADGSAPAAPASSRRRPWPAAWTRCMPARSSSPPASPAACSPPACSSGSWASRTTGATTPSSASRPSWRIARWRRCRAAAACPASILSHDFVEAALMRRAGWQVWLVPDLPGS